MSNEPLYTTYASVCCFGDLVGFLLYTTSYLVTLVRFELTMPLRAASFKHAVSAIPPQGRRDLLYPTLDVLVKGGNIMIPESLRARNQPDSHVSNHVVFNPAPPVWNNRKWTL